MWQWISNFPGWSALILLIFGYTFCKFLEQFLPWIVDLKQKPHPLEYFLASLELWILPGTAILLVHNWLFQHPIFSASACLYLLFGTVFTFWHRFVTKKFSFSWFSLPSCVAFWPWFAMWGLFIDEMQRHDYMLIKNGNISFHNLTES